MTDVRPEFLIQHMSLADVLAHLVAIDEVRAIPTLSPVVEPSRDADTVPTRAFFFDMSIAAA